MVKVNVFTKLLTAGIFIICFCFLTSCKQKESPYIPKPEKANNNQAQNNRKKIKNIAFIHDSNIYLKPDMNTAAVPVFQSAYNIYDVKITYDASKIAYRNNSDYPVIIDTNGQELTTLSRYYNYTSMEWAANNETLCILNGKSIYFHGPEINIPELQIPYPVYDYDDYEITDFTISRNNDIAYIVTYYDYFDDVVNVAAYAITSSDQTLHNFSTGDHPVSVEFSGNKTDLSIGYSRDDYQSADYYKVHKDLSDPDAVKTFENGKGIIYRSDLNYAVMYTKYYNNNSFYNEVLGAVSTLSGSKDNADIFASDNYQGITSLDWK